MAKVDKFEKAYEEFGYKVEYTISEDTTEVGWVIRDTNDDLLMHGLFKSKDYYRSSFNVIPADLAENVYESLFYLYFENIKLECIALVEDEDVEESEEEM